MHLVADGLARVVQVLFVAGKSLAFREGHLVQFCARAGSCGLPDQVVGRVDFLCVLAPLVEQMPDPRAAVDGEHGFGVPFRFGSHRLRRVAFAHERLHRR